MKNFTTLCQCNGFDSQAHRALRIRFYNRSGLLLALLAMFTVAGANAADLFNNFNTAGVSDGALGATVFTLTYPAEITELATYHWYGGQGKAPGTLSLISVNSPFVNYSQAFPTQGEASGPVQNANWVAYPNVILPSGTYAVVDSDPGSWSQNTPSHIGFTIVRGNYLPMVDLFNNFNSGGVFNAPAGATVFTLNSPAEIRQLVTYHWNYGQGKAPGTITLQSVAAPMAYNRQFQAFGQTGSFNVANADWVAPTDVILPAGSYAIFDSDPSSWSQNSQSSSRGFAIVRGNYLSISPVVLPPPPPPPAPPPPPVFPPPCDRTTGATVELAQPSCFGRIGTPMSLVVLSPLTPTLALAGIQFTAPSSPTACRVQAKTPPNLAQVTVFAGPPGSNGLVLTPGSGTGMSAGSTFTTNAPPGLCVFGSGNWTWFVNRLSPGPAGLQRTGVIDCFTVICP